MTKEVQINKRRDDGEGRANKVWINDGLGKFTDSGQFLGDAESTGLALGDLDGDGDLDTFVANMDAFAANMAEPNYVWVNDGSGKFTDSGQSLGDSATFDVALGDLDGDGDLDAFVGNGQPDKVWINNSSQ